MKVLTLFRTRSSNTDRIPKIRRKSNIIQNEGKATKSYLFMVDVTTRCNTNLIFLLCKIQTLLHDTSPKFWIQINSLSQSNYWSISQNNNYSYLWQNSLPHPIKTYVCFKPHCGFWESNINSATFSKKYPLWIFMNLVLSGFLPNVLFGPYAICCHSIIWE